MKPEIALLSNKSESDKNFSKFLDFFGIECINVTSHDVLMQLVKSGIKHLAASLTTFNNYRNVEQQLYDKLSSILLYDAGSKTATTNSTIEISNEHRKICREFSGLSFINTKSFVPILNESIRGNSEQLISINNDPVFAIKQMGNCHVFLISTGVIDIKQKISCKLKGSDYFIQLAPIAMFLKYTFAKNFKDDSDCNACLIMDDTRLIENHGFLNYHRLLKLMDTHNFFTTIAFIPWNYKRTDEEISNLFKKRPDRFSLCVHGCDHAYGEFAIRNIDFLDKKIKLATARMIEHEKITGIPFDRVMVFPRGLFSLESMEALKKNNYLAAVNTESLPVNSSQYLNISDYLQMNIMKYANFPLYVRNQPNNLIDFAFDLFWGKPIFIVIHHTAFKGGGEKLVDIIIKINSLSGNVKWDSVGNIIGNFITRREIDGDFTGIDLTGLNINGFKENFKIFMRRHLSEFRDNYLSGK